jgi:hypothetical protein
MDSVIGDGASVLSNHHPTATHQIHVFAKT